MAPNNSSPEQGPLDFFYTDDGAQWIEDHPDFLSLLDRFTEAKVSPERFFRKHEIPGIGMGSSSNIYAVDELAVKISAPWTGRRPYHTARPQRPEDLVEQFRFMAHFAEHLRGQEEVIIPEQYFAVNGVAGNLRAEQNMDGWRPWVTLARERGYGPNYRDKVNRAIKVKTAKAIGRSSFRLGLDLNPRGNNILVPEDSDNLERSQICIIDQPAQSLAGSMALVLAKVRPRRGKNGEQLYTKGPLPDPID